eukprot:SAG31_NODE_2571_length_5459_cov_7.139925_1_plen_112_part_00
MPCDGAGLMLASQTTAPTPPPSVASYFATLDAEGKAAVDAADWWARDKADPAWEPDPSIDHRVTAPMHFVQGRTAPWYIEGLREVLTPDAKNRGEGRRRKMWAVYLGPVTA